MAPNFSAARSVYRLAENYVTKSGFRGEIDWQRNTAAENVSESDFLREIAWVILCSGFRERTIRRMFDYLSLCFCDWESAKSIVESDPSCRIAARVLFNHNIKLSAITNAAYRVNRIGFPQLKQAILNDPIHELQRFQYIGPVTVLHLAKNLGFDVAKPDRHLSRVSSRLGFKNTFHFCRELSRLTGEPVRVIDIVLWRYLADNPDAHDVSVA